MTMATYLTVDAFAEEISVDDMTVRRMIANDILQGVIDVRQPGAKRARLRIPASEIARIGKDLKLGAKRRKS